ncbi:hypothetical protein [Streptomyces sp. NBC_01235]
MTRLPRTRMRASVPSGGWKVYVTCVGIGPATEIMSSSRGGSYALTRST